MYSKAKSMNQFDFFKRFPTENDAIDFIVKTKYKNGYLTVHPDCSIKQVVLNVFKDIDKKIYQRLL